MNIMAKRISFLTVLIFAVLLSCALCFGVTNKFEVAIYENTIYGVAQARMADATEVALNGAHAELMDASAVSKSSFEHAEMTDGVVLLDEEAPPVAADDKPEPTNLKWFVVALSILNGILLMVNGIMIKRVRDVDKHKKANSANKNTKMYSTLLPMMMLGAFIPGQLTAVIVLAIVAGLQVLELSLLVSMKSYKDNHVA